MHSLDHGRSRGIPRGRDFFAAIRQTSVRLAVTLFSASLAAAVAFAAEPALPADATYRANVPEPSAFVGFPMGSRHWTHDEVDEYVRALAASSDRIRLEEYARSHDRKPLVALAISSPENLARLEDLARAHRDYADPDVASPPPTEAAPLVAWFCYGVHGDEPSATHAGLLMAYYLAASEDPRLVEFLKKSVILLDPCLNPDGFDRFSRWSNATSGKHPSPDPQSREHRQSWPPGRVNYYGFDLNRDWLPAQQPESQGRLALYRRWEPNVLFDFHEMETESTYFFQPGVPSRNNPLTPAKTYDLTRKLADFYAAKFDETGELYFTEEKYDDFYPGKGSTYPDLHGGVGVLFEQGSARGVVQESRGGELTLTETIEHQTRTSLAALEGIAKLRDDLVAWQRDFYAESRTAAAADPVRGYFVRIAHDPVRRDEFVKLLDRHGLRYERLTRPFERDGKTFSPDDSFFVSLRQRDYLFAKSVFERRTEFGENVFYDVSAWNLPAAFGAQVAEMAEDVPADLLAATPAPEAARVELPLAKAAYVIDPRSAASYKALSALFELEVRPRVAMQPFAIDVGGSRRSFPPGAILVALAEQDVAAEAIRERLNQFVAADELTVTPSLGILALDTSRTAEGADLGSDDWKAVAAPSVGLLCGKDLSAYDVADAWFALDARADVPVSMLDLDDLLDTSFDRYRTLVFPDGDYRRFPSRKVSDLTAWQKNGGTIVLMGRAISWGATQGLCVVSEPSVAPMPTGEDPYALPQKPYANVEEAKALEDIAGVILRAQVDTTHPIGFGFDGPETFVFRSQTLVFEPSRNPYSNPLILAKDPVVSGYVSARNRERLSGGASVTIQYAGAGRTILFADESCFRAYFRGSERSFLNAVFFGSLIQDPSP